MQNNNNDSGLIIARGISKSVSKSKGQPVTRLFFDAETAEQIIGQIQHALQNQEDGVSVTILEGEGKNGLFGMIGVSGLEARQERPAQGQKRAYTPEADAAPQAPAGQRYNQNNRPGNGQSTGGYKPKTPGYSGRK